MLAGSQKLRVLREQRQETLEHIATDAGITYRTLWKNEQGITQQPARAILHAIVEALDQCAPVSAGEWQAVFDTYGYRKPYPLPTEEEIEEARQQWRAGYGHIGLPAYLVDFSQRLLDWNRYAPRLIGMRYDDIRTRRFQNVTLFDVIFDLAQRFVRIENRREYLPSLVHVMKSELQLYKDEPWYAPCIATAQQNYPHFRKLWESFPEDSFQASLTGLTVPIRLHVPGESSVLTFQLVKIDFVGDVRFRIVQWIPVGAVTTQTCLAWVCEESDERERGREGVKG